MRRISAVRVQIYWNDGPTFAVIENNNVGPNILKPHFPYLSARRKVDKQIPVGQGHRNGFVIGGGAKKNLRNIFLYYTFISKEYDFVQ